MYRQKNAKKKSKVKIRTCLSEYVSNYVNNHFDFKRGGTKGIMKVLKKFKINKDGDISAVLAKGINQKFELEAIRVIRKMKKFIPATIQGKPVEVIFDMPILGFVN